MDPINAANFASTLITIASGLKGLLMRLFGKHFVFPKINSKNSRVRNILETFQKNMKSAYGNHIFSLEEISQIQALVLIDSKFVKINEKERNYVKEYVYRTFEVYNESIRKSLNHDAQVLLDNQESSFNKIQKQLNDIAEKDSKENSCKFEKAIERSKNIGLINIDDKIKNEYEIDRSEIIEKIRQDNAQIICISGSAGVGKSALCKKLISAKKYVLYTRAEQLNSASRIDDLWHCNVENCVKDITTDKLYIFIDALEFIADVQNSIVKIELLQELFELARKNESVRIVTSCRTSDMGAFAKLFANYKVQTYKIDELSREEIEGICSKYPLIKELSKSDKYSALLKNPLYISLILSNFNSISDVNNECDLRNKIWNDIICLGNKARDCGLNLSKIRETIEKIVFDRAKEFRLGVNKNDLDEEVLKKLESECIVAVNGDLVRLRHDLFEDICFEINFDRLFDECNGEYATFFNAIKDFGRCAYRRYQIWISNKIFAKDSREKFLYQLVFNQENDENWRNQTIIGIVKSEYCQEFFYDYYTKLLNSGLVLEFIRIINLYAFDAKPFVSASGYHFLQLIPTGKARECLIRLISENQSYDADRESVVKLCDDYSKSENRDLETSKAACKILEHYVAEKRNDKSEYWGMDIPRAIKPLLSAIYRMADASKEWVAAFLNEQVVHLKSDNREDRNFSEEILEWTIKECENSLIEELPDVMCRLAKNLWLSFDYKPEEDFHALEREKMFGLSHFASDHNFSSGMFEKQPIYQKNLFFTNLLNYSFWKAFYWAVDFINDSIAYYASVKPDELEKIDLVFVESGLRQSYWGNPKLWICASREYETPLLLSDIIYWLKNVIINSLEGLKTQLEQSFSSVAYAIRSYLFEKSNNVALLSIINYIGLHFQKELPGFAVDLATNMDLIWWDLSRYSLYHKDEPQRILEKHICQATMGVSSIGKRYELDPKCDICLRDYVRVSRQMHKDVAEEKCKKICDYLYSITNNNAEEADRYLQIQIMEGCVYTEENSDNVVDSKNQINGAAKKLVERSKESDAPIRKFLTNYTEAIKDKDNINNQLINATIDYAIEQSKKDAYFKLQTENKTIQLIFYALADIKLNQNRRDYLCCIWIDGIRQYLKRGSFASDNEFVGALWVQLRMDISIQVKNEIKKLMLDILTFQENNGIILELSKTIKRILCYEGCRDIARPFFNTILMLAKDEMKHQKYNAAYLKNEKDGFVYEPNMHRLLWHVDRILHEKTEAVYSSQKDEIIRRYLYEEESLEITDFDIDDYDISTLCFVANCGLDFKDPLFAKVVKEILKCMIRIWGQIQNRNGAEELLQFRQRDEVEELLRREIVEKITDDYTAIDLLFDDVDYPILLNETERFYSDIFKYMQCAYFDNSDHPEKRNDIEKKMLYIGQKVENHPNKLLKRFFYKALCFCLRSSYVQNPKQFKVKYSYQDKHFINEQLKKYGKYDIEEMFNGICNLNEEELLPEILDGIDVSLEEAKKEASISGQLKETMQIANVIITAAFVKYSDEIKKDKNLTDAYERILETLVDAGDEQAAWLLDEFMLH